MIGLAIPVLLVVAVIGLVIVIAVRNSGQPGEDKGDGSDIIAYLVLAIAMGVAGFALADLASTAFPGDRFVFDPAESVATSLAALVVSTPFLIFFWRRQSNRRVTYPASNGWTLYLTLMEVVFMGAFVISAVSTVSRLITGEGNTSWPQTVVFGLIVGFHEFATMRNPPRSDAAELPRVVGSAIGLVTAAAGLAGTLMVLFGRLFDNDMGGWHPWVAMVIVGVPVWAYRWLRPWESEKPSIPRLVWATVVLIATVSIAIGSATALVVMCLQYLIGDEFFFGGPFDGAPVALGLLITAIPIALIHRRNLGPERSDPIRVFDYALAGLGLAAAVTGATALTVAAFERNLIVGGGRNDVITFAVLLVVGLIQWRWFTRRADRAEPGFEKTSWPRRFYHLGLGIIFGLVAAGALITSLVIVLREVMGGSGGGGLTTPLSIFIFSGLATWYLLAGYKRDRATVAKEEIITPFDVTLITSHPGSIATKFPKQARLQVIHRGDSVGAIDDETADAIVAAVANQSSLVWVDADGFRVAPRLKR